MKITHITVGITRLIALPKYENVKYECTATAELNDLDEPADVKEQLSDFCRQSIIADIEKLNSK